MRFSQAVNRINSIRGGGNMSIMHKESEKNSIPTVRIILKEKGLEAAYRLLTKKVVEEMENSKKCGQPSTSG